MAMAFCNVPRDAYYFWRRDNATTSTDNTACQHGDKLSDNRDNTTFPHGDDASSYMEFLLWLRAE